MSNPKQKTCFVIRPFNTLYNKRHNKIFVPAIKDAGLSVHLAGGPGVINITKEIEDGIRNADICFADVSDDNPNVWYEVGFAFACGKKVAMVCNTELREVDKLPFDIKVIKVISYSYSVDSESQPADQFQEEITEHVRELSKISPPSAPQPHILDKHQAKESSKNNSPSASQPPVEDDTSIIHDGLTRGDFKILRSIMTHCSTNNSTASYDLKRWHDPLDVDISTPILIEKGYVLLNDSSGRDVYKSTEKALKLYGKHKHLFGK